MSDAPDTRSRNLRRVADHFLMPGNPIINTDRVREAGAILLAMNRERALLRAALCELIAWGKEIPAPYDHDHRERGYMAFDRAKRALRGKR
jgi:hypothetical protein